MNNFREKQAKKKHKRLNECLLSCKSKIKTTASQANASLFTFSSNTKLKASRHT